MRKLSEEEMRLWKSVTEGMTEITPNVVPYEAPRTRPQVQDISFNAVLDLHNLTIQQAYEASNRHLEEAFYLSIRKVQHITGKSGQISQEYETWARLHPRVRKIEKQNDGGAWKIWLKKL
jgi:DNA-nicking Smr family endonuclease